MVTVILATVPLILFIWVKQSGNLDNFLYWSQQNSLLFVIVLFILKTAAFVYPPLPGGILTLGSIPVVGWWQAYLVDACGSLVGSSLCYVLGRKYGVTFLHKVLPEDAVSKITSLKIKKDREFESVFVFRILGGSVVEFVAYAGGILKIRYPQFITGSVISHALIGIPTFYLAKNIFTTQNILVSLLLAVVLVWVVYKFKGRYFE